MLRENRDLFRKIHLFLNFLNIFVAWWVAYMILSWGGSGLEEPHVYFLPFFVFAFVSIFYLSVRRFHPDEYLTYTWKIFREMCFAIFFGILFVTFIFYFLKLKHLSRLYLFTSCFFSLAFLLGWNFFVCRLYQRIRKKGWNYQHVLLVGNEYTLPPVIRSIRNNPALGQRIEAVLLIEGDLDKIKFEGLNVYRGCETLTELLNVHVIDNALFSVYRQNPAEVEKAMLVCQERGISVWLKPDFMHGALISRVGYLADIPLFIFELGPKYGLALSVKYLCDFFVATLLLVLLFLPVCVISLLVMTSPGPVFFVQKRVGLNGRRFTMFKFRTMSEDAEQHRDEYNLKNEMQGITFKMKNDPRITTIGKILRKYSLDELPQILNVFKGDMSLVGPRPLPCYEMEFAKGWHRRRLSMRPGITCLWQISGRNQIKKFDDWAKLDLKYIDEWNLLLDLKILLKTIPVVLRGTGV